MHLSRGKTSVCDIFLPLSAKISQTCSFKSSAAHRRNPPFWRVSRLCYYVLSIQGNTRVVSVRQSAIKEVEWILPRPTSTMA